MLLLLKVITLLNTFYKHIDSRINERDVYKVEIINDQYMVVSGIPKRNGKKCQNNLACLSQNAKSMSELSPYNFISAVMFRYFYFQ